MTKDVTMRCRIKSILEWMLIIGILAGIGYLFYLFIWPWIRIFWVIFGGGAW